MNSYVSRRSIFGAGALGVVGAGAFALNSPQNAFGAPPSTEKSGEDFEHLTDGEVKISDRELSVETAVEEESPGAYIPDEVDPEDPTPVLEGVPARKVDEISTMVAVSWGTSSAPDSIEVRSMNLDGKWNEWIRLSPIGDGDTQSTEAAWIGPSREVEVRASLGGSDVTEEMTAHLIKTSDKQGDDHMGESIVMGAGGSTGGSIILPTAITPGYRSPSVISRSEWGADESLTRNTSAVNRLKGVFIHHTAGTNSYTKSQSAQIIRGYLAYHTKTLGWADLGYNVLIDKYGQIFEGRKGGLSNHITGAHTLGFNSGTFGVSVMGDYSSLSISSAAMNSLTEVIAWKMSGSFLRNPYAKMSFKVNSGGTRFSVGSNVSLNIISGHRDAGYTECPGLSFYKQFGTVRSRVKTAIDKSFRGHYDAFVKKGGESTMGTVKSVAESFGKYEVTTMTKGLVISEKGINSVAYISSFASNWWSSWGRPLADSSGDIQLFENGTARRKDGKVTFTKLSAPVFKDVPRSHIFFDEIESVAAMGIAQGWSDGTYRPNSDVLRDAIIAFIYRAKGSPSYTPPRVSPFADVSTRNVFYKEIAWAYENGITEGWKVRNGKPVFKPLEPVKRDAIAAFFYRVSNANHRPSGQMFKDVNSRTIFYKEIEWFGRTGIANGWPDGTYKPLANTKRDAMAAFMDRWVKKFG